MEPITYTFDEFALPHLMERWRDANDPGAEFSTSGPSLTLWVGIKAPPTQEQLEPVMEELAQVRDKCAAIRAELLAIFVSMKAAHQVFFEPLRRGVVEALGFTNVTRAKELIEGADDVIPEALAPARLAMLAVFDKHGV